MKSPPRSRRFRELEVARRGADESGQNAALLFSAHAASGAIGHGVFEQVFGSKGGRGFSGFARAVSVGVEGRENLARYRLEAAVGFRHLLKKRDRIGLRNAVGHATLNHPVAFMT